MPTLPNCFYSVISVDVANLCLVAADDQGAWRKNMPSAGDWARSNWYVFLVVGLVLALAIAGIAMSAVRWCRRIEHRHRRELRNKRVDGMIRIISASFHGTLSRRSSASASRRNASNEDDDEKNNAEVNSRLNETAGAVSRTASRCHIDGDGEHEEMEESFSDSRTSRCGSYPRRRRRIEVSMGSDREPFRSGHCANARLAAVQPPQHAVSQPQVKDVQPHNKGGLPGKLHV
ncbi:hypothetical protein N2W54_003611 [Lotmaria passim]